MTHDPQTPRLSRRDAAQALLALCGGTAALAACGTEATLPPGGDEAHALPPTPYLSAVRRLDLANDLRSLDGADEANDTLYVLTGYYAPGDGGGGVFFWSTPAEPDDGGTVFANEAAGGCWKRLHAGSPGTELEFAL